MENTVKSENLLSLDVVPLFPLHSPVGTIPSCGNGIFSAVLLWIILLNLTRLKWKNKIFKIMSNRGKKIKLEQSWRIHLHKIVCINDSVFPDLPYTWVSLPSISEVINLAGEMKGAKEMTADMGEKEVKRRSVMVGSGKVFSTCIL